MSKALLKTITSLSIVAALSGAGLQASGATMTEGSIAVIGMNHVTDEIRMVTLKAIPAGTVIKMTDRGWDATTNAFTTLASGDGTITWTLSASIPSKTILKLYLGGIDATTTLTNETNGFDLSAQISVSPYTAADPLTIAGDQFFIYQDADSYPFFIFGINNSSGTVDGSNWNTTISATLRDSYLPNGSGSQNALTNGTNAIGLPGFTTQQDNVQYNGATSLTNAAGWLNRITNLTNWTGDNTGAATGSITPGIGATILLPIHLTSFTAELQQQSDVLLRWQMAKPEAGGLFEVQHSKDGQSFTTIYNLTSAAEQLSFSYLHSGIGAGAQLYRLRMTDLGGKITFSPVTTVNKAAVSGKLNAYPNPATAGSILYLNNSGIRNIRIYNILGREAAILQSQENGSIQLPENLSPGLYLLQPEGLNAILKLEIR